MIITGTYVKTLYKNESETVCVTRPDTAYDKFFFDETSGDYSGFIKSRGLFPEYFGGAPLRLTGIFKEGEFILEKLPELYTENEKDAKGYIKKIIPGAGKKTTDRITKILNENKLSENIFNFDEETIAKELNLQLSLSAAKLKKIMEGLTYTKKQMQAMELSSFYGLSVKGSLRLLKRKSLQDVVLDLQVNPYIPFFFCNEEFKVCDKIAYDFTLSYDCPLRVQAVIINRLMENEQSGNTCIGMWPLYEIINNYSLKSPYRKQISKMMFEYALAKCIRTVVIDGWVYLRETYESEFMLGKALKNFNRNKKSTGITVDDLIKAREEYEKENGITLEPEQFESAKSLLTTGVKAVVGGPGTGKTTSVKFFLYVYEKHFPEKKVALCAPTGRAAARMFETTGRGASTIHKAIGLRAFEKTNPDIYKFDDKLESFLYPGKETPTDSIDAELIIVDESSMVGTELFNNLLSRIKQNAIFIMVGDTDQLPSISAGNVLMDILNSGEFETYKLVTTKRQKESSNILTNVYKIKDGFTDLVTGSDFEINKSNDSKEIKEKILSISHLDFSEMDNQIICSTISGPAGTYSLNKEIQKTMPFYGKGESFSYGKNTYYVGDKVIMLRNTTIKSGDDYIEYCNGDMGYIIGMKSDTFNVALNGKIITLDKGYAEEMDLAYAITVHKFQGSEAKNIILSLPKEPKILLNKNLLFTSVSRAKEYIGIYSEGNSLETAVKTIKSDYRQCRLLKNYIK